MGGLHQGHLSLVEIAKQNADRVVVSIFVNPTQFAENEDFGTYPRNLDKDLALLKAQQVDCIFTPSVKTIYPKGMESNVRAGGMGKILCGKTRPYFFDGVLQVVQRLFDIVRPDVAVFGQKDYQQLCIIKRFTSGVEIIVAPIVREIDGLAMSTRNKYLSVSECKIEVGGQAVLGRQVKIKKGELDTQSAIEYLQYYFQLDYLEVLDANTFKKINKNTSKIIILSAVYLNKVRLIDNIIFNKDNYVQYYR